MMEKMLVQWREELSEELTCDILPFWMAFLGDGVHFAGRIDGRGKAHPEAREGRSPDRADAVDLLGSLPNDRTA